MGYEIDAARRYDEMAEVGRPLNFVYNMPQVQNPNSGGSSNFKGVSWNRGNNKWKAEIYNDDKKNNLRIFDDEEKAALKYDEVAATLGRSLNFPGRT